MVRWFYEGNQCIGSVAGHTIKPFGRTRGRMFFFAYYTQVPIIFYIHHSRMMNAYYSKYIVQHTASVLLENPERGTRAGHGTTTVVLCDPAAAGWRVLLTPNTSSKVCVTCTYIMYMNSLYLITLKIIIIVNRTRSGLGSSLTLAYCIMRGRLSHGIRCKTGLQV